MRGSIFLRPVEGFNKFEIVFLEFSLLLLRAKQSTNKKTWMFGDLPSLIAEKLHHFKKAN